jgi:hypothetical protein
MDKTQDLHSALKKIVNGDEELYVIIGSVNSVDNNTRTCEVAPINYPGAVMRNVRLTGSLLNQAGQYLKPKVGSLVLVSPINKYTGCVVMFSELDEIQVDCDETIYNGGENGGLVKIEPLIDKINQLETKYNDLVTIFNGHTHTAAGWAVGGIPGTTGGTTGGPSANETEISPETRRADLEDTKFKH